MKTSRTNPDYRPYNGHPNWQLWNVSMWIVNDYGLYKHAVELLSNYSLKGAADELYYLLKGQSTPDGATYSKVAVRYALRDL